MACRSPFSWLIMVEMFLLFQKLQWSWLQLVVGPADPDKYKRYNHLYQILLIEYPFYMQTTMYLLCYLTLRKATLFDTVIGLYVWHYRQKGNITELRWWDYNEFHYKFKWHRSNILFIIIMTHYSLKTVC